MLENYRLSATPIGICQTFEGDEVYWGRVLHISETSFRFQHLDLFGREDIVEEYEILETLTFDENPTYARRLELLSKFQPTTPDDKGQTYTDSRDIYDLLTSAHRSGEAVQIDFP